MLLNMPVHLLLWISQLLSNLFVLELQQPYELLILKQILLDIFVTMLFFVTGLLRHHMAMFFTRTVPRH
jgi:hypothetical protein